MNLVVLEFYADDNMCEQHMFWTEKPQAFFCTYEHEIKHTFVNVLKEEYPSLANMLSHYRHEVWYYDLNSLDII